MAYNPTADRNFPMYGIVVGGHDADPDPNQNGLMRVYLPDVHGNNVKKEHLGFSQMIMQPNQGGATEFNGVPDPGQAVLCMNGGGPPGSNILHIIGVLPENRKEGGLPGNLSLNTAFKAWSEAVGTMLGIRIPPNIKETIKDGARIREKVEKGDKHKHDLLKGLPSHGASYSLAGLPLQKVTNVATAIQNFNSILTGSMLSGMPGTNFSVGNILSSFSEPVLNELLKSLSPDLALGLQNMFKLMQSMEVTESGNFATAGRVDPTTYLENAFKLLKDCKSLGDIIEVLKRLQYDTSLFGLDKLADAVFETVTPFGNVTISISATGEIKQNTPNTTQKAIQTFSSLMTSGAGFPGVELKNMFTDSAKVMNEMFNRLPNDKLKIAKDMMEQAVAPGTPARRNVNDKNKKAHDGQNVL